MSDYTTTTSNGCTVESDPAGYLHDLVLDTVRDGGEDFGGAAGGIRLALAVFARIDPADYEDVLLVALGVYAEQVVDARRRWEMGLPLGSRHRMMDVPDTDQGPPGHGASPR